MYRIYLHLFTCGLLLTSCSKEDNLEPEEDIRSTNTTVSPFGIDGLNRNFLDEIAQLGDGISGINGISWDDIEPKAPQDGVHEYKLANEMVALNKELATTGRKLQLNFRLSSDWALNRDPNQQVTSPEDGSKEEGILGVKSAHEEDLAEVIKYILMNLEVESLQVGSEAENEWVDSDGYLKALAIIYKTAKEVQSDIIIMAFGFNPANYFTQPQNFNQTLITSKLTFVEEIIENGQPWFDVFSFHASREFEAIKPTVSWIRELMQANGYDKPIWVDDMYSAPWLDPNLGTPEEKILFNELLNEEPAAILMFDSMQADYMVKKLAVGFEAGIEKIFVSTDVDFDFYYIQNWRYAGMLSSNGDKKPAYYNLKLLIEKTDDFEQVNHLGNQLYEFTFADKEPVYLYWNDSGASGELSSLNAEAFTIYDFTYRAGELPVSNTLSSLESQMIGANPVLIEPL